MSKLYRDGERVLECLQRALRVADSCMEMATSIELFVEILDRYVYYFDQRMNLSVPFLDPGGMVGAEQFSERFGLIYMTR